jgi:hypothetical protein
MPSLEDHFQALTKVRPPDDWPDLDREPGRFPRARPPFRRIGVAAFALLVAIIGSLFVMEAFHRPGRAPAASPSFTGRTPPSPGEPTLSPTMPPQPEHGVFSAMFDAISTSSPAGWRFDLRNSRLDGDWRLDGQADDGSGPGGLFVDVTVRPGMLEAHPCADGEFRRGALCVERRLPNGDLLVLRDVVVDRGRMKTIEAVLIHPDRSGVGAEAGNWVITPLPSGSVGQGDLSMPRVTRDDIPYTVEQLGRLVQAVDRSTQQCLQSGCG